MDDEGTRLWERVCATVRKFGEKTAKQPTQPPALVIRTDRAHIDLHGLTVSEAHSTVAEYLAETDFKAVTVVTGRSGQIRAEFPQWMDLLGYRYVIVNGDGAFRVNTKRLNHRAR